MPDEQRLFVGREQELNALKEAIARPEGRLILTVGAVGVGKSALLQELAVRVDQTDGWVAVPYQLNENDSSETFLPRLMADLLNVEGVTSGKFLWNAPGQIEKVKGFLSAVAKLPSIPGLGEAETLSGLIELLLPDDKRPPREKFVVFLRYAASRLKDGQRLVLIFDPDKYLDKSQEPDWGSLARDIPERVTLIFAQRPDDVLAESEALLTSPKTQRIPEEPLGHLPREKSDELITEGWRQKDGWMKLASGPPAELCQVLWDKYEGWPLPLTMVLSDLPQEPEGLDELLAAAQEMPKKLRDLLRLRYGKAAAEGDDAVRLLQGLALLQRPATVDRVAALCGEGCTAAALTAAANRPAITKCLSPGEKGLLNLFHATIGECVVAQISEDAKRDLHRGAAGLYRSDLDANAADKEALDRLPYHAYHAGEVKPFLEAVDRVGKEKYRLHLLRSYERDLRWALPLCRDLAKAEPAAFMSYVAMTLNNLGGVLGDLGERAQARQALEEALPIHRNLAKAEPATFLPDVAMTLNNLGSVLRDLGERAPARQALEEALLIRRDLAKAKPAAFMSYVAGTLNNLGSVLSDLGEPAQARQAFEEALPIFRDLAKSEPAAFLSYVAGTLNNLGNVLRDLGERAEARNAFEKALDIYGRLAKAEPAAFEPALAMTLNNLGTVLRRLGEQAKARQALEDALSIRRDLAKSEPAAFLPYVATTLNNLGLLLRDLEKRSQARQAFGEALAIYTRYAKAEPRAFAGYLTTVVRNAVRLVEQTGDNPEEWPALVEAIKLLAQLHAAEHEDAQNEP